MNCEECLVEMETISTSDIAGSAVAMHSAHCKECARVLQAISDADRLMMQERDESYFTATPDDVARRAVVLGQRRGVFAGVSLLSIVLLGGSVWYAGAMLQSTNDSPRAVRTSTRTESFVVRCLSTNNVRLLLQPYLTSRSNELVMTEPPLRVLTVRSTPAEIAKVREVLERFDTPDNGNCQLPDGPTKPPK